MGDRLLPAVRAAKRGHDVAYTVLINHLRPAIYDIHRRKVFSHIREDDWYSEGLELLMRCVRRYNIIAPTARFSTYFIQSLHNRATDIIRQQHTKKQLFLNAALAPDTQNQDDIHLVEISTNTFIPEKLLLLRDSLDHLQFSNSQRFRETVQRLLGVQDWVEHDNLKTKRQVEQFQYRLKKQLKQLVHEVAED